MTRITTLDLPTLSRATVGFDRLFNDLEKQFLNSANTTTNYPPYNVIELSDNEWIISIAVAGFSMEDLNITLERNTLTIEGNAPKTEDVVYLHKGIAGRNFRRAFTLADHLEVVAASLSLGMLNIRLKRNVPEELQPKKIEITAGPEFTLTLDEK